MNFPFAVKSKKKQIEEAQLKERLLRQKQLVIGLLQSDIWKEILEPLLLEKRTLAEQGQKYKPGIQYNLETFALDNSYHSGIISVVDDIGLELQAMKNYGDAE